MAIEPCQNGDGNPSVYLGTFLSTGDTDRLCQECLPVYLTGLLAALTDTDPDAIASVVMAAQDEETATGDDEQQGDDEQTDDDDPKPETETVPGPSQPATSEPSPGDDDPPNEIEQPEQETVTATA